MNHAELPNQNSTSGDIKATGNYTLATGLKSPRTLRLRRYRRYRELAIRNQAAGKLDSAQRGLEKAILISTNLVGRDNTAVVADLEHLALLMQAQGKHVVSRALFERVKRVRASA